jgi:hypothetical protein
MSAHRSGWLALFVPAVAVLTFACGSASPGDTTSSPESDAASQAADAGTCDTWTCLYADYFGPSGVASCAGDGTCHGSTSQPGYTASMFLCPPGDQSGCYASITSLAAGLLTPGDPFDATRLYVNLRKSAGGGTMPKSPAYTFTTEDIQRLSSWVAAGAQDD